MDALISYGYQLVCCFDKQHTNESLYPEVNMSENSGSNSTSNLMYCPDCGQQISRSAQTCPHCGHPFVIAELPKRKGLARKIITALIIIFLVIPLIIWILWVCVIQGIDRYVEKGKDSNLAITYVCRNLD